MNVFRGPKDSGKHAEHDQHLARLKKHGNTFEIVIDPDAAIAFKKGEGLIDDVILFPAIFSDAKKGEEASQSHLEESFSTTNTREIATKILKEGEIQLTSTYRQAQRDKKKKRIIDIIHRNAIDPRTNAPLPLQRLENAFHEAKIRIDENKQAEEQVEKIIDTLNPLIPIKFVTKELSVKIPRSHAAKAYQVLHSYGKIYKETWDNEGNWKGIIALPGGLEPEFYEKLNKVTHGDNIVEVIKNE